MYSEPPTVGGPCPNCGFSPWSDEHRYQRETVFVALPADVVAHYEEAVRFRQEIERMVEEDGDVGDLIDLVSFLADNCTGTWSRRNAALLPKEAPHEH